MDDEDQQLITGFLRGEGAAIRQVQEWLRQASRRFRPRLAQPWEDVEQDLLLEVTALLKRGSFRGAARLKTYLWRVAQYTCLNLLRDQGRRRPVEAHEEELPELPDPARSPLDELVQAEAVTLLGRLMAELSPECRDLWQQILAGTSYREMSRVLGVAEGALRVRVLRCRRRAVALWQHWQGR